MAEIETILEARQETGMPSPSPSLPVPLSVVCACIAWRLEAGIESTP